MCVVPLVWRNLPGPVRLVLSTASLLSKHCILNKVRDSMAIWTMLLTMLLYLMCSVAGECEYMYRQISPPFGLSEVSCCSKTAGFRLPYMGFQGGESNL